MFTPITWGTEMVEEVGGGGVAAYMPAAAANVHAKPKGELPRPEIADTRTEERGETPPSKKAVEVQISAEAKQMAVDPRQEKPMQT